MKEYPFEVRALDEFEGCFIVCYMTKGHHDKQRFVDEVKAQFGQDINIGFVHHSFGKLVPVRGMKGTTILQERKEQIRGSFPMTYIDV